MNGWNYFRKNFKKVRYGILKKNAWTYIKSPSIFTKFERHLIEKRYKIRYKK